MKNSPLIDTRFEEIVSSLRYCDSIRMRETTLSSSNGYDNANRMTRSFPNGVNTTYEYDGMSRLTRLRDVSLSATLFDRQYSYDTANQISQIVEPTLSRVFGYDNIDRLTSVTGGMSENYVFDGVGNRTGSHRSSTYTYQPFNKLTSTQTANYSYDANGNMTTKAEGSNFWRYTWDHENRMARAATRKQTATYRFDALGRRVQRYVGSENTKFIYDGNDVLADDNAGTLTKYQNGPGIDNKLRAQAGSDTKYFLADHLGSTNALSDATGTISASTAYDSFGNATNPTFPSRYQFTGREFDKFTDLHYYRARQYDHKLGRFISEDPIGFGGGDVNLYGYVGNSPINKIDPSGETEEGAIWRLQYHNDPATRPYVAKWEACESRCIAQYGAALVGGFTGFTFGQPMNPKPFTTPGSSPGTSPISQGLSKAFPQKLPGRVWAPTMQHPFASTNVAGRAMGRWIPFVGAAMMIADFGLIVSCTNECYNNDCSQ